MLQTRIAPIVLAAVPMVLTASVLALAPACLYAQEPAPAADQKRLAEGGMALKTRTEAFSLTFKSDKVVKDKPYSADSITETVQTFADGNRIVRQNQAKYYRDSAGRTRREQTIGTLGPSSPAVSKQIIFISDPVAKLDYTLNPANKTAVMIKPWSENKREAASTIKYHDQGILMEGVSSESKEGTKEDLGKQTIAGVECVGTRITKTIPAGEVGNERPISIVKETWYSPDIDAIVQSKSTDPRFGDVTYSLSNVQLGEQPQQLFAPPADYQIKTAESLKVSVKSKEADEQK